MAIITPGITGNTQTGTRAVINSNDNTTGSGNSGKTKADELKNQFLNILLTQLQNQNPLDPMDTKEFTGQLAQFSTLEQQIDTNDKLDSLLTSIAGNKTTSAFTYIGKEATIDSAMTTYQGGKADWTYTLPSDAKTVTIKVTDAAGNTVFSSTQSKMNAGSYGFEVSAEDFNPAPAEGSVLKLTVNAADADGKTIASTIQTTVVIDGIETTDKGVDMRAGNLLFGMDDIKKVSTPKPVTPTETADNETEETPAT